MANAMSEILLVYAVIMAVVWLILSGVMSGMWRRIFYTVFWPIGIVAMLTWLLKDN